jgi:competence protein ComEC
MAEGTPLKVWFVNVGHGDCTIVKFPGAGKRIMMVDICNSKAFDKETKDELLESAGWTDATLRTLYTRCGTGVVPLAVASEMRSYEDLLDDPISDVMHVDPELRDRDIFRFVLTHPDMDHMTGLYRLFQHEPMINVVNFWDTDNTKEKPSKSGKGFDERDWDEYQSVRKQETNPTVLFLYRGAEGEYYTDDNIQVLSPTKALKDECNEGEDWNNLSQVIRISHGKSSIILPGDVETKAQEEMVKHYGDMTSTILKAPHHGRDSGYLNDFAKAVSPEYTIVSVGKKENDASDKYRQYTAKKVFSTRFMGTIYAELFTDGDVHIWNSPKKGKNRIDVEGEAAANLAKTLLGRGRTGLRL